MNTQTRATGGTYKHILFIKTLLIFVTDKNRHPYLKISVVKAGNWGITCMWVCGCVGVWVCGCMSCFVFVGRTVPIYNDSEIRGDHRGNFVGLLNL